MASWIAPTAGHNLDMIAWDEVGAPVLRLHTRLPSNPGYPGDLAIANAFVDVVSTYGLDGSLTPIIDSDGAVGSDHVFFWAGGYSAILATEDDVYDFNDYYHTSSDKREYLSMPYFTNFVKAAVGTAVHLLPQTTYRFRVRARNRAGVSGWSNRPSVTMPVELTRPTRLQATIRSSTRVLLEWNDRSDNEDSFEVQLRTGSQPWQDAARVEADVERVVVSGLRPETTYSFRVRARSTAGFSPWSNKQTVNMPAG